MTICIIWHYIVTDSATILTNGSSQIKRCSGGTDAQCLQPGRWARSSDIFFSILMTFVVDKHRMMNTENTQSVMSRAWNLKGCVFVFAFQFVFTGMPGAGSQYSVMGRPQDPRSSMFGSSINLNGEFCSLLSRSCALQTMMESNCQREFTFWSY